MKNFLTARFSSLQFIFRFVHNLFSSEMLGIYDSLSYEKGKLLFMVLEENKCCSPILTLRHLQYHEGY